MYGMVNFDEETTTQIPSYKLKYSPQWTAILYLAAQGTVKKKLSITGRSTKNTNSRGMLHGFTLFNAEFL